MTIILPKSPYRGWLGRQVIQPLADALAIASAAILVTVWENVQGIAVDPLVDLSRVAIGLMLGFAVVIVFRNRGHYSGRKTQRRESGEIALVFLAAFALNASFLFLGKIDITSRLNVAEMWLLALLLVLVARQLSKSWLMRTGSWTLPVVIVGTGPNARDLAAALTEAPDATYLPLAMVAPFAAAGQQGGLNVAGQPEIPLVGLGGDPFELVRRFGRVRVIVALESDELKEARPFIDRLNRSHRSVEMILPVRGMPAGRVGQTRYASHDLVLVKIDRDFGHALQAAVKRWFDILAVTGLLILVAPLFGILSLLVLTSGRPVFFAHERIGRHGVPFKCLKFRTMAIDAQERLQAILASDPEAAAEWALTRKLKKDPRITPIGHWLRKTSLDEIPQLFNALRGDMSLVGPRPVTRDEVVQYGAAQVYYMDVRPGITGLWQVSGRNDVDFAQRVHLDTLYTQNRSLLGDVNILFMTLRVVLLRQGAY